MCLKTSSNLDGAQYNIYQWKINSITLVSQNMIQTGWRYQTYLFNLNFCTGHIVHEIGREGIYHVQLPVDSGPHVWQLHLLKMVESCSEAWNASLEDQQLNPVAEHHQGHQG